MVVITGIISQNLLIRLSQQAISNLRRHLIQKIINAPLRQIEEIGTSRLLTILTEDILVITNGLATIPLLCINLAIVTSCLVYLGWLSVSVSLPMLGVAIFGIHLYRLIVRRASLFLKHARKEQDIFFDNLRVLTEGIKELKLNYARRKSFLQAIDSNSSSLYQFNLKGMTRYIAANNFGRSLLFFLIGLIIFVLPALQGVDLHVLTGFSITILYLVAPIEGIMSLLPILSRTSISLQNIEALGLSLRNRHELKDCLSDFLPTPNFSNQVVLRDISYTYKIDNTENSFQAGPINLTFCPGELTFLIGGNGSGKTTLAKLIAGLYIPHTGDISIDNKIITYENRDWYRQHFSVIFSDFFLFQDIQDTSHLDSAVQHYLIQFRLEQVVQVKNGKLSTTSLSQGQRKRLALVAAYIEDRPFIIFDEWAADQDPIFKEIFYRKLLPELKNKGKTILVISHDDRYFHIADRLYKLDEGRMLPQPICS